MAGCPFRISTEQVKEFFGDFQIDEENVKIEDQGGRRTGFVLVVLNSEADVQKAKIKLNREEIDGRYIELYDQGDSFMRSVLKIN